MQSYPQVNWLSCPDWWTHFVHPSVVGQISLFHPARSFSLMKGQGAKPLEVWLIGSQRAIKPHAVNGIRQGKTYQPSPCWTFLWGRSGLLGLKYTNLEQENGASIKRDKVRNKNKCNRRSKSSKRCMKVEYELNARQVEINWEVMQRLRNIYKLEKWMRENWLLGRNCDTQKTQFNHNTAKSL